MSPRRRKNENKHLPQGLNKIKMRGVTRFRYRFPTGKDIFLPIGTLEMDAIEAATIYNQKYRNPTIQLLMNHDQYNKPLKEWLKVVIERVDKEEFKQGIISQKVFKAFESDIGRLTELQGHIMSKSYDLSHVNDFLTEFTVNKSNEVYNRKITFLKKVGSYLCDMSAIEKNFAESKKRKPKEKKQRNRLSLEHFNKILEHAEPWLKIAMLLSIQTTHSVNEISKVKYKDCELIKIPFVDNGLTVHGTLRIHRHKVKDKEASRVAIPITQKIKTIIEMSRADNIASPYVIHKLFDRKKGLAEGLDHHTQLCPVYISREFSNLRDKLKIMDDLPKAYRPTFHEIRSLSIHLYDKIGYDAQARAAHTDSDSTKIYKAGHVEWVEIQAAELAV